MGGFYKTGKNSLFIFFSRERTFSPSGNGASPACLKASCLRSQPQAASVFDRRQQDAARFHMLQGKRSVGMAAVASRAASAGPAHSNVLPTRHGISRNRQTSRMPFTTDIGSRTVPRTRAQMSMRERSQGKGGMPGSLRAGADAHLMKIGETRQASPRGNANIKSPPSSCATKEKDGPALLLFPFPSRHAKSPYSKRTVRR